MADGPSQLSDFNDRYEDPAGDPLFNIGRGDSNQVGIFIRKELLEAGHIPESARIVGRDEEIKDIAAELRLVVQNGPPNNVTIYGKTGTGESLIAHHITERAHRAAESNRVSIETVYVDYAQHNTQTHVARTVTRELSKTKKTDFDVPRAGTGSKEYYDYLWEILNLAYDAVVIILDEADHLNDGDILIRPSRARESGKADYHLGVIAVSGKIEYQDQLNERIKSNLREEGFVFQPYDANQLREIMRHRRDASHDDVLPDDVTPLTTAFAAQGHDDVRKAIEILRHAGELAEQEGADQVVAEHVRDAQEWAKANRFEELLRGSTTRVKFVLYSLALLTEEGSNGDEFSASRICKRCQNTAEMVNTKVLSECHIYELLKEQMFLGVVESTRTDGGRREGSYLEHRPIQDTGIALRSMFRDSRLKGLA